MRLPKHYTPGVYHPIKDGEGVFYVIAPGGQIVKDATFTSRPSAQAKADALNEIRHAMAPRKKAT